MAPLLRVAPTLALAAALSGAPAPPAAIAGVTVALTPDSMLVAPGGDVALELWVTAPGDSFNAYEAVVAYDPSALTFLQASPLALQEGTYMKSACGNTVHFFSAAGDSLKISHSLLCDLPGLPGPGQLYRLAFRAGVVPQWTTVRIRRIQFYKAGFRVGPAYPSDAVVAVGVPTGADNAGRAPRETRVRAAPNPFRAAVALVVETAVGGEQRVVVCDVQGRAVRHLERGDIAPGTRRLAWDGRDDAGARLAPGVYRVRVTSAGRAAGTRVILLP